MTTRVFSENVPPAQANVLRPKVLPGKSSGVSVASRTANGSSAYNIAAAIDHRKSGRTAATKAVASGTTAACAGALPRQRGMADVARPTYAADGASALPRSRVQSDVRLPSSSTATATSTLPSRTLPPAMSMASVAVPAPVAAPASSLLFSSFATLHPQPYRTSAAAVAAPAVFPSLGEETRKYRHEAESFHATAVAFATEEEDDEAEGDSELVLEDDEDQEQMDVANSSVVDIDEADRGNPLQCSEYIDDIFEYLRRAEVENRITPEYLANNQDVRPEHRQVLLVWISSVLVRFKLSSEVLFVATDIFDRFLSTRTIGRGRLQLLAITALFIASKYEELRFPSITDFAFVTDGNAKVDEIRRMERLVLAQIGYKLGLTSPLPFLRRFSKAAGSDSRVHTLAKYILELTPCFYSLLHYKPSQLAAASVYLARHMTATVPVWHSTVRHYSGYTEEALLPCARELNQLLASLDHSKNHVCRKYASATLLGVSKLPLVPL